MAKDEGWEEIDPKKTAPSSDGWEEIDSSLVETAAPNSSTLSDFGTGVAQGATFGFWDEIKAALAPVLKGPRTYRSEWQKLQADLEAAKKNSPNAFLAGELTGGIGSTLGTAWIPGLGEANAVKTAALLPRLAEAAKTGATVGALQGGITGVGTGGAIGAGTLGDAASGAARGGVAGALFSPAAVALGEMGPSAVNLLKEKLAKPVLKGAAPLFRVNKDTAREVLSDPALYRRPAQEISEVGDEFVQKMNVFAKQRDDASKAARSILNPEKPVLTADEAGNLIDDAMIEAKAVFKENGLLDSEDLSLIKTMDSQKRRLKALEAGKGFLSETDVREAMDAFAPYTKFERGMSAQQDVASKGYNRLYGKLNEKLKASNTDYGDAMEPVSKDTGELKKLAKALGLKNADEFDKDLSMFPLEPTDSTYSKLANIRNKEVTAERLDAFSKKFPDTDLAGMARRVRTDKALEKSGIFTGGVAGAASGSKPAFIAGVTRDLTGSPVWAALAKRTGPETTMTPGTFENLVTRGAASLFAQPWNPYEPQK